MKRNSEQILVEWLVIEAQLGEASAMTQLVHLFYPKMLRFATRQLQDQEAAKDVVQNTLEVLSRDIGRVSDPSAFTGWLYQVLHRKGVNFIRQAMRTRQINQVLETDLEASTQGGDEPAESLQLEKLLVELESDTYQIIHLHYLEGLSIRAIAEVLVLAEGTVKSRLFNARRQLHKLTGDNDE